MAKQLILVRHAKADWSMREFKDIDRPLSQKGVKDASEMPFNDHVKALIPDFVLSSHAKRAKQTADAFKSIWGVNNLEFAIEPQIYEATLKTLWEIISQLSDSYQKVALFGHNPGFTYLCSDIGNIVIDELPPCGIMVFNFEVDKWSDILPKTGKLLFYDYPKS